MKRKRTLKEIDDELRQLRNRTLDTVRGSSRWETAWLYIDRLLDERLAYEYLPQHARSE